MVEATVVKTEKFTPHHYNVSPGTTLFESPYGSGNNIRGHAQDVLRVRTLRPPAANEGKLSFFVEVESPPEMAGDKFYLVRNKRQEGWLRI